MPEGENSRIISAGWIIFSISPLSVLSPRDAVYTSRDYISLSIRQKSLFSLATVALRSASLFPSVCRWHFRNSRRYTVVRVVSRRRFPERSFRRGLTGTPSWKRLASRADVNDDRDNEERLRQQSRCEARMVGTRCEVTDTRSFGERSGAPG